MTNRILTLKQLCLLFLLFCVTVITACTKYDVQLANPFLTQGERFRIEQNRRVEENQAAQHKGYQESERQHEKAIQQAQSEEQRKKDAERQAQLELRQQKEEENRKAKEQAEQEARLQAQQDEEKRQREEAQRWNNLIGEKAIKDCNAEIFRLQNLLIENPYDVGGKCYLLDTFSASSIQILSRTVALLMYQNQVVYADFGKISAPVQGQWRSFVVKGDADPYKYTSAAGSAVTAIKVHILKELSKD